MPTDNVVEESWQYEETKAVDRNARLFRNWINLDKQYDPWKAAYQDVADYIAPGHGRFMDSEAQANQKTKAAQKIINPAAPDALHMLGAGLHGGLSSPARPWFQLAFTDPGLNEYSAAKQWLDDVEKELYAVFKRSNFYSVIHSVYEEVGAFATGALFADSHPKNIVNFSYFTAGDYRIAIDELSRCYCMYRKIRMQVHQMAALFGPDNLSERSKRLLDTNKYEWTDILHVIEPNAEFSPDGLDSKKMPFRSVYIEWKENSKRLSDSGYMEMPVMTPRWTARSHEAYGWGPGLDALGLAKAIQRMEMNAMLVEDKYLDPPLGVPSSFKDRMLDLSPGAKNVYDIVKEGSKAFERLVDIDPNAINLYEGKITAVENKIRRLFFNELFLMIAQDDKRMTATEVAARNEEKMIMIGPTIERLLYELLDPLIERTFNLCARAGLLPPPPEDIANAEYKVDYVSILAQAQKLVQSQSMTAYLNIATGVAAIAPESVDKTDWDEYIGNVGDMLNVPSKVVREQDQVDSIRKARAEEAQRQQQIAEDQANADTMQKLGNSETTEDTALGQLQQSMGAA